MRGTLANAVAAETIKVVGLPAARVAALGTITSAAALGAVLAAAGPPPSEPMRIVIGEVVLMQIGLIALGVLSGSSEYNGRQIATTLRAVPNRSILLASKALAFIAVAVVTAVASVTGAVIAVWLTSAWRDAKPAGALDWAPLTGAIVHLVLIGLLGLALSLALRSMVAPLTGLLALVLIVSPLLVTRAPAIARWLPDQAGSALFQSAATTGFTPAAGALILLGWVTLGWAVAALAVVLRDG